VLGQRSPGASLGATNNGAGYVKVRRGRGSPGQDERSKWLEEVVVLVAGGLKPLDVVVLNSQRGELRVLDDGGARSAPTSKRSFWMRVSRAASWESSPGVATTTPIAEFASSTSA